MQLGYDEAVEYLTRNPDEIMPAWFRPAVHLAGRLFYFAGTHGRGQVRPDGQSCGCLTMIRGDNSVAWTDAITKAIRADDRLPERSCGFQPHHLPAFRDWQTYLDSAIRGHDPAGVEFCPIVLDLARKAGAWLPPQEPVKRELPLVVLDAVNKTLVFGSSEHSLSPLSVGE